MLQPGLRRDGREALPAALRVGEEDQVGVRRDDVLTRQLRVVARAAGAVRDVAKPEHPVDLADERAGRDRVVVGRQLVVDGERPAARNRRERLRDARAHRADRCSRPLAKAGRLAELRDLRVGPGEVRRLGLDEHRDLQLPERLGEPRVGPDDHQIGPVARDRLDVRRVPRELRPRRTGRVVGEIVDGDDPAACADREQGLRRGGRQRDDPPRLLADGDLPRRRGEHDRERLRCRGRVGDGTGRQCEDGCPCEAGGEQFLDHEKPPHRAEEVCWAAIRRTSLPPRVCSSAWRRRPGSSPEGA